MYKKILALCLSAAIAMSTAITPIFADNTKPVSKKDDSKQAGVLKHFNDSYAIDWAEKSIEKLGALGVINGMENGLFKPNSNVTHIEAIAMVLRLKGEEAQAKAITTQPKYFKGQSAKWSWGYLQLALDEGIIVPSEDEWFNPNTPAKRHEIAKYIVRALGKRDEALKNMNARLSFKDASAVPKSSVGYVYVINKLGIMQGSKNEFQPNKPITRAEMAVLLDRAAGSFDDSIVNENSREGVFVAYDKAHSTITLNINNTQVVYKVNSNAPVYRNNKYYLMETLKPGDIIEVVLDQNDTIIFIEFKENGTAPATGRPLSIQHIDYSQLPADLRSSIDTLKHIESYAAFRDNNYVYLVAARGQLPSGGYSIRIINVYREQLQAGRYNMKAVVETQNPSRSIVTQAVTYPYDIVKLAYFDGIDKINFYDNANNLLSQTILDAVDGIEVINGTIDSVDAANSILYVEESDDVVRAYSITSSINITLNNRTAALSALVEDMNVQLTRTNGVLTSIAATTTNTVENISGKIDMVDITNRIIYLKESDNEVRTYLIPANAAITLDNRASTLSALSENMNLTITKTNDTITSLAAQSVSTVEVINGKIASVDAGNRLVSVKESNNTIRTYYIASSVRITLNNRTVALSALTEGMAVAITRTNGIISKLEAAQTTQTINGKIDAVDTANNTIKLLENNNVVNSYAIPTEAQITLDGQAASLSVLANGMAASITKVDDIITRVAAQNAIQTVEGVLINVYPSTNNSTINVKVGKTFKLYVITPETAVFYNNQSIAIQQMPLNTPITIKIVNGIVTEVRNK